MIKKKAIFKNLFSNHTITPMRLYNFGRYVYNALSMLNKNGEYTAILSELNSTLKALHNENVNVDMGLTEQVSSTETVDKLLEEFVEFIKDIEPVIARALGGRKSAGYRSFYPNGVAEYDNVNKTNIVILTQRIDKAAEKNSEKLGEKLTTELQVFKDGFNEAQSKQPTQIATVNSSRGKRRSYFVQAQGVLTAAVHYVAFINRDNIAASSSIFPFEMLYPKTKHKIVRLEDKLVANETKEILNTPLNKLAVMTVKNTCDNASLLIWAVEKAGDGVPAYVIVVQPSSSVKITAAMRAKWNGHLLLIQNESAVNEAHYKIDIKGLSKKRMPAKAIEITIEEEPDEQPLQMIG